MTTNSKFLVIIATLIFNISLAQNTSNDLSDYRLQNGIVNIIANDLEVLPIDTPPHLRKEILFIDQEQGAILLNHNFSEFSNSISLQILDFTGRTLKSFNVNTLNNNPNEFIISDLLSGTYNYVLIINNDKKIIGQFTLKD